MSTETVRQLKWDTGAGDVYPVFVREIRGDAPGPTLVLLGGEHGIEVAGPAGIDLACRQLARQRFAGTVLAIPSVAPCNIRARRHYYAVGVENDQQPAFTVNTWPLWPGDPKGDPARRLTHLIYNEVVGRADVLFNFHAWPRSSAGCLFTSDKVPGMRELAVNFGQTFYDLNSNWGGTTLHELLLGQGRRAALVEMQGQWRIEPDSLQIVRQGIFNILITLGMVEGTLVLPRPQFQIGQEVSVVAPADGFFIPLKALEQRVRTGELLGYLLDLDTGARTDVLSPADGAVWLCGRTGKSADVSPTHVHAWAQKGDLIVLIKRIVE